MHASGRNVEAGRRSAPWHRRGPRFDVGALSRGIIGLSLRDACVPVGLRAHIHSRTESRQAIMCNAYPKHTSHYSYICR
jgi:hypothetical protein